MQYKRITNIQILEARVVDLYKWLERYHPTEVKFQYGSALLKADEHISVKKGIPGYRDFRSGEGGDNIRYLREYLGYSFPDAVNALREEYDAQGGFEGILSAREKARTVIDEPKPATQEKPYRSVPEAADTNRNVYAYLLYKRGIPGDVINWLVDRGLLYQSKVGNNAVFITPKKDYFETRGTNTTAEKRCQHRKMCALYAPEDHEWCVRMDTCPDYKPSPFKGGSSDQGNRVWFMKPDDAPCDAVYVCEAAIDAISLYVLQRGKTSHKSPVYVSIGGAGKQSKIDFLKRAYSNVIIATDNDEAGDKCRKDNPELKTIRPVNKDWNEDLRKEHS